MNTTLVQSRAQADTAYVGLWTDWSHGSISGAVLTLTQRDGGFLIAFVALFVTFTGTCFWAIVAFTSHQLMSREFPQDLIYHQRQALLRNTDGSASGVWRLLCMLWAWRRHKNASVLKRTAVPILLSFCTMAAFAVAGIFSSKVATSKGGQVLVSSPNCGIFSTFNVTTRGDVGAYFSWLQQRMQWSANYALTCYGNYTLAESCRTFVQPNLSNQLTRESACPFPGKDRICRSSFGAIRLDSGFIDSHSQLGINASPGSRFLYRSVKECAPILNEGYTKSYGNASSAIMDFSYGPVRTPIVATDWTFQVAARPPISSNNLIPYSVIDYSLHPLPEDIGYFEPIPELLIPDADISVYLLSSNDIQFMVPVKDPWFSASTPGPKAGFGTQNGVAYLRDDPARTMACVETYQFCNPALPDNSSCTILGGIRQAFQQASGLYADTSKREQVAWSLAAIQYMAAGFHDISDVLGSLLARNMLVQGVQAPLPDNQWELELEYWFKLTLADLQRTIMDQAVAPTDPGLRQLVIPPTIPEQKAVCASQKIRSDSYISFNILGLTIVFSLGGLIIIMSALLPLVTEKLRRRRNQYKNLEWRANGTLQLQRLAHEGIGAGVWQGACNDYPTTGSNDLLAILDISNPKHPVLKASDDTGESTSLETSPTQHVSHHGTLQSPTQLSLHEPQGSTKLQPTQAQAMVVHSSDTTTVYPNATSGDQRLNMTSCSFTGSLMSANESNHDGNALERTLTSTNNSRDSRLKRSGPGNDDMSESEKATSTHSLDITV
ncbi:hypothetical protein BDV96DRAFT_670390 [Lophiotrema nucula]|uniref:Uncharacterized protein n=1 Tax=Lophiotrema nucula TaxID=690887 RepID=A0A6A5YP06_9PLEO|nr:hypothetical protein BDV96DRAFT_670390 [Lophiotrema nucula]